MIADYTGDMKFYVASRTNRSSDVKALIATLTEHGHTVTHDWTNFEFELNRPYPADIARLCAEKDLVGVQDADVFILLSDESGSGMYVELGYALATNTRIYSVGEHNGYTVFQFLPAVKRVATISEVLEDLGIVEKSEGKQ